jgi:hypothetical protein
MSLGIFSFDLQALIDSLSNYFSSTEPFTDPPVINESSLDITAEILQNTTKSDAKSDEISMANALNNAVTSIILLTEPMKKTTAEPVIPPPKPTPVTLDDETRKEIEQLIRSLQTSVIYNYQSTDIIDETVSLNNVANFPHREIPKDAEKSAEKLQEEKKRIENKLQLLRDDLKKAMLKNNTGV